MRATFACVAAGAVVGLGACGGKSNENAAAGGGGDERAKFEQARLDFSECMRKHGVEVPDPEPGERGLVIGGPDGPNPESPAFREAMDECDGILERARPQLSPEQEQEFREGALKMAKCLREHGLDVPDPTFEGDGRMRQALRPGVSPQDPAFREAEEACRKYQPRLRSER